MRFATLEMARHCHLPNISCDAREINLIYDGHENTGMRLILNSTERSNISWLILDVGFITWKTEPGLDALSLSLSLSLSVAKQLIP